MNVLGGFLLVSLAIAGIASVGSLVAVGTILACGALWTWGRKKGWVD